MAGFLANILKPHTPIIAQVALTITFLHFLSGLFLLNDIRKKGSSTGVPAIPFLGGLALSFVNLKFGAIIRDDATIRINFIGFALNVIYLYIYYYYTPGNIKTKVWGQIGLTGLFCIASLLYAEFEDSEIVEYRFGIFCTAVLMALVGSPFLSLGEVFRTKSTESLPLPIMLSGTVVSFSWLIYGAAISNSTIIVQNVLVVIVSMMQLSLFLIFPKKRASGKKAKQAKKVQ